MKIFLIIMKQLKDANTIIERYLIVLAAILHFRDAWISREIRVKSNIIGVNKKCLEFNFTFAIQF